MDQPKMERLLRLMQLMSGNVNYSVEQLSEKLEMSERTIYRYVDTFKEAGFDVTKLEGNVFKLGKKPKNNADMDRLMAIYGPSAIADYIERRSNAAIVDALGDAVSRKLKVRLLDYESGSSHTIRDRLVEPYSFTNDYIDVCAFDLEDGRNKIFKIQRIGEVELLAEQWSCEAQHRAAERDIFRMSGPEASKLKLRLSVRAKNLLVEEYPLAERDLTRDGDSWLLETDIYNYAGACRFYVGLAGEIDIVDSPAFASYVQNYIKTYFTVKS